MAGWCVDPEYRGYAHPLHARAISRRQVVYFTVTPAPHTLKTLAAVGYRRYSEGQVIFAPLLSRGVEGARVVDFAPDRPEAALLSPSDARLLADHSGLGCAVLIGLCGTQARPLVFQPRRIWRELIPCAHLIYSREPSDLARFGPAYGRRLAATAASLSSPTQSAPSPASPGVISPSASRDATRSARPSPCDLADSELVMFGDKGRLGRRAIEETRNLSQARALMFQGTGSDVGKSLIVAGLCRASPRAGCGCGRSNRRTCEQRRGDRRGRRDRPRPGAAGARLRHRPHDRHESGAVKPQSDIGAQVIVHGHVIGAAAARDYYD